VNESDQLKRSVQALAQPAPVQVEPFPNFVVVGDELALDFDDALLRFRPVVWERLTHRQRESFEALDKELHRLSGPGNQEFWLDRTLLDADPRWEHLRVLAATVLQEMGWPKIRPEPSGAVYIPGCR
jgi:hypothetical protein